MRKLFPYFITGSVALGLLSLASVAGALNVTGPIAALGNCATKEACKAYCDEPEHAEACLDFSRSQGLMSAGEAETLKRELRMGGGPGGCKTDKQCRAYCAKGEHQDECVAYAREHNLIPPQQVEKVEKIGPGGCKGSACKSYCQAEEHREECLAYAEREGMITPEQASRARLLAKEAGPGGCKGDACKAYCENSDHIEECAAFAEKHGLISKEEIALIKKTGLAGGPGGCKGKEQCRQYCEDPEHQAACIEFAEKNGMMSREEAERAKKFMAVEKEGGPGGCKGKQACGAYCRDEGHQDECFEFAKKNGLIKPGDEQDFERGRKLSQKVKEAGGPGGCKGEGDCHQYCAEPAHVEECVAYAVAHGGVPDAEARVMLDRFIHKRFEEDGKPVVSEEIERFKEESLHRLDEFKKLEEQFRGDDFDNGHVNNFDDNGEGMERRPAEGAQVSGMQGPGGCNSLAACIKFCKEHTDECRSFGEQGRPAMKPSEDGVPPGRAEMPDRQFERNREQTQVPPRDRLPSMNAVEKEKMCIEKGGRWNNETCIIEERRHPEPGMREGAQPGQLPVPTGERRETPPMQPGSFEEHRSVPPAAQGPVSSFLANFLSIFRDLFR